MTHTKKEHYQFTLGKVDPAVVGRLGGGYPVPGVGWMQYLYGFGNYGGSGYYGGSNTNSTSNQGTDNDGQDSGSGTAGDGAGGDSGDGSGSM